MQTKKAYAALIAAILISMVLVLPVQLASAITITGVFDEEGVSIDSGNVGDTITVKGNDASPGGLVNVYWDEVHAWDEEDHNGLIDTDYATTAGLWEVEFDVPETANKTYGIIGKDMERPGTPLATFNFTVEPKLTLDPDAGVAGDRIEVDGTGFGADVRELDVYFDLNHNWDPGELPNRTAAGLEAGELTDAYSINTNKFGTFAAPDRFDVPDGVKAGDTYKVVGIDESGAYGVAVFTVGFYIKLKPDEGPPGIMVTITGKLTEDSVVDVEFGIWNWTAGTWPKGTWVKGTRRTVLEDVETDGEGFFEAEFEVPDEVEAGTYLVVATDDASPPGMASREFEVLEAPTIELTPDSGMPGDEIEVEGSHFTADSDITLTFDGIDVTPAGGIETNKDGWFSEEFVVPDVAFGDYEVEAEDEEGLSDAHDFEVRQFVLIVRPRAGPYYRGATMSFEVKSTEELRNIEIDIYDPTGYPFYHVEWPKAVQEEDDFWYVPWYQQTDLAGVPLPDDAPLGKWTYEGALEYYDLSAARWKDYDIKGTFTVVELPYETMGASLTGIKGVVDTIKTDVGTVKSDVSGVAGDVTGVKSDVVAVKSDVAGVKTDVAGVKSDVAGVKSDMAAVKSAVDAVKAEFPIEVPMPDLTPMWVAVVLSLVAAIAAVAAVVMISRKLA